MAGMVTVRILDNHRIEFVDGFQGLQAAYPVMVSDIKTRCQHHTS